MNNIAGLVFIPPAHGLHIDAQVRQFAHQSFDQCLRSAMGKKKCSECEKEPSYYVWRKNVFRAFGFIRRLLSGLG